MIYAIDNKTLSGKINAISSKSHLHRLMIAAALYAPETEIFYEGAQSEDISATIKVLAIIKCADLRYGRFPNFHKANDQ